MKERSKTKESPYPTLKEHLLSRRRFLGFAGATLAAGGLLAACSRGLGVQGGEGGGDGGVEPDSDTPPIPGDVQQPEYFLIRLPVQGELSAYLLEGGYARFYVEVATYSVPTRDGLQDYRNECEEECRRVVEERTYEELDSSQGILSAEDDLFVEIEDILRERIQGGTVSLEAVTLNVTHLEPYAPIDGGMPQPSYP